MLYEEMVQWKQFIYLKFGFRPFRASEMSAETKKDVNDTVDLLEELANIGVVDKIPTKHGTWYVLSDLTEAERYALQGTS